MLRQAQGGHLKDLPNIPNPNTYVIGWAVSWHLGDVQHCLSRLEAVYIALHPDSASGTRPPAQSAASTSVTGIADFDPNPPRRKSRVYEIPDSAEPVTCECGTEIWFVRTPSGALTPVTSDGVSHFETCDKAAKFSRRNAPTAPPKPAAPKPAAPKPQAEKPPARPKPRKPSTKKAAPTQVRDNTPPKAEAQPRLMF